MINFPCISDDARKRPSGENDSDSTLRECWLMRNLVFFFASGVQMTTFPFNSNPLKWKWKWKSKIAEFLPFLLAHYCRGKNEILSFQFQGDWKGNWIFERERLLFSILWEKYVDADFFSWIPYFSQFPSVDQLTKPKWNCRLISWPRPLPRRPFVSRLDAKPNYSKSHRPLWSECEWVCLCPSTKSTEKRQVQDDTPIQKNNDNLPLSILLMNKWPNISSVRPMPYLLSNP